ncbi:MAG: Gfo/Idh/MocA family protein [Rhodospirillales bacterium]
MTTLSFPPAGRRLRLGFVGQGAGIGLIHANGARLSGRWDITAGALSSNPERAKAAGHEWGFAPDRIYTDFREMARAEAARADGVDAVAIVTPNHLHGPAALAFMAQGIDIICDKPLCRDMDEVPALKAAHQASGVIFGLAHAYTCHVMVRQAREMIQAGDLGELRQVHVEYFQEWAIDLTSEGGETPWRLDPARTGETFTTADVGTHAEHMARFVTGLNVESLRAQLLVTGAPKNMDDTAFMHMRMTGGVPGTLMVSQAAAGTHCGLRFRIHGTKAALEWNQEDPERLHFRPVRAPSQIITRGHGAGMRPGAERLLRMPRGHPEALTDAWANLYLELGAAVEARREGRTLPEGLIACPALEDGERGMRFIAAAALSSREDRWVDL